MKTGRLVFAGIIFLICFLTIVSDVNAITGSIGNSKMILKASVGDEIEKSILVKNENDVSLDIILYVDADINGTYKDIELIDESFTLAPGEERKANFLVNVNRPGTTEYRINVKFIPIGEKTGVGLSSRIIVIANGDNLGDSLNIGSGKMWIVGIISIVILIAALVLLWILKKNKGENKSKKRAENE